MESLLNFLKKIFCGKKRAREKQDDDDSDDLEENNIFECRMKKNTPGWNKKFKEDERATSLDQGYSIEVLQCTPGNPKQCLTDTKKPHLSDGRVSPREEWDNIHVLPNDLFNVKPLNVNEKDEDNFLNKTPLMDKKNQEVQNNLDTTPTQAAEKNENFLTAQKSQNDRLLIFDTEKDSTQKMRISMALNIIPNNIPEMQQGTDIPKQIPSIDKSLDFLVENPIPEKVCDFLEENENVPCSEKEPHIVKIDEQQFLAPNATVQDGVAISATEKEGTEQKENHRMEVEDIEKTEKEIVIPKVKRILKVIKITEEMPTGTVRLTSQPILEKIQKNCEEDLNEEILREEFSKFYYNIQKRNDTKNYPLIDYSNYCKFFEILKSKDKIPESELQLSKESFQPIKNGNWINDEIVNSYSRLIIKRSAGIDESVKYPSIYIFDSLFYKRMKSLSEYPTDEIYEQMSEYWNDHRLSLDLFNYDLLFFPINFSDFHWSLVTIDTRNENIHYYDSGHGNASEGYSLMESLSKFFSEYIIRNKKKKQEEHVDDSTECQISAWKLQCMDMPSQSNVFDCGIFVCKFMDYLSRGQEITFTQEDMPYFRILIGIELINCRLFSY